MGLVLITAAALPLSAQTCPAVVESAQARAELHEQLRNAPSAAEAQAINAQLWEIWLTAPDARAQAMLDRGVERMRLGDLASAVDELSALVAYCPDYPEGYNQRAFAHYLQQDFSAALEDIDKVLSLLPEHIGALSGKGLTLIGMGRAREAQEPLRRAVDLNPYLSERALLIEE